ncbi:MAG: MFS transporter, partial [Thermoplasmata archaeon]|nr:MFS transporter [Thermoplasmata archaeon]
MKSTRAEGPFRPTKLTLVAMLLTSMLMLMGGAAVAPALPLIQAYFPDSSEFAVSLIITLPSLAVAVTGMGIGIIADRFGKVRTLVVSLAIFTIAGVAGFFVDDLNVMLVMRFVLGVGIGGLSAAVTALMAEYYTGASRVKVLGYQSAAMGIGALVLESTGGWLAGFSWREPFLVYLIGVPIILLCVLSMREPSPVERPDHPVETGRKANMRLVAVCYLAVFMCQMIFFLIPTKLPTFLEDP